MRGNKNAAIGLNPYCYEGLAANRKPGVAVRQRKKRHFISKIIAVARGLAGRLDDQMVILNGLARTAKRRQPQFEISLGNWFPVSIIGRVCDAEEHRPKVRLHTYLTRGAQCKRGWKRTRATADSFLPFHGA
jgi:hypothetical protein